ncbi:hypothetical protein A8926_6156 [Saccharopolyspora spinosa]|uniref:Uncharacterized protein n=1 Tax=Saccharopolyspora spinosa TaxID=60894 RepID=A0A2N3Y5A5_SACSN|nr:hypothetical protein A8926_6156 [Saccharopolyspora spinosa]
MADGGYCGNPDVIAFYQKRLTGPVVGSEPWSRRETDAPFLLLTGLRGHTCRISLAECRVLLAVSL